MMNYMADRSVAIIPDPASMSPDVGSGLCVAVNDRYLIATAKHVLDGLNGIDELRVLPRGEKNQQGLPLLSMSETKGGRDEADVAWLEVSSEIAVRSGLQWVPVSQLRPGMRFSPETAYFLCGTPSLEVEINGDGAFTPLVLCLLLKCVDAGADAAGVALEYPPASPRDTGLELVYPGGYSGGAVWTTEFVHVWPHINAEASNVVGLVSFFKTEKQYLQSVAMEYWIDLVRRDFGEINQ